MSTGFILLPSARLMTMMQEADPGAIQRIYRPARRRDAEAGRPVSILTRYFAPIS